MIGIRLLDEVSSILSLETNESLGNYGETLQTPFQTSLGYLCGNHPVLLLTGPPQLSIGAATARPVSVEARSRYEAVSEALFLSHAHDQTQRLSPAGIVRGTPQHVPPKMRPYPGGNGGVSKEQSEPAVAATKSGSTTGYRPRTSLGRPTGDIRGMATVTAYLLLCSYALLLVLLSSRTFLQTSAPGKASREGYHD